MFQSDFKKNTYTTSFTPPLYHLSFHESHILLKYEIDRQDQLGITICMYNFSKKSKKFLYSEKLT